jgi:outer membrane receptor protein involved in Fe transport
MDRLLVVGVLVAGIFVCAAPARSQEDRGGFTLLLTLGYGLQNGAIGDDTYDGIGGLSFGIGGFVEDDVALMFRLSGTNVQYDYMLYGYDYSQDSVSGVAVFDVQWWTTDRLNLEFGGGFGFVDIDSYSDRGLGLYAGIGYAVLLRAKHSLQLGIEYAPVFADDTVNNLCFNVGFQFL